MNCSPNNQTRENYRVHRKFVNAREGAVVKLVERRLQALMGDEPRDSYQLENHPLGGNSNLPIDKSDPDQ